MYSVKDEDEIDLFGDVCWKVFYFLHITSCYLHAVVEQRVTGLSYWQKEFLGMLSLSIRSAIFTYFSKYRY